MDIFVGGGRSRKTQKIWGGDGSLKRMKGGGIFSTLRYTCFNTSKKGSIIRQTNTIKYLLKMLLQMKYFTLSAVEVWWFYFSPIFWFPNSLNNPITLSVNFKKRIFLLISLSFLSKHANFEQSKFGLYNRLNIEYLEYLSPSSFVPTAITQPFFELQTPDFAWKFVWIVQINYKSTKVQKVQKST